MVTGFHQIPYIRGYPIEYTVLMKVIAFQHARNEPMGLLATILQENKIPYEYVMPMEGDRVSARDATHLVFPGGPMSVNDTREYPCLQEEKALIRSWVSLGKPVLGICLGAQLIAGAFGAAVFPCLQETGWREIKKAGPGTTPGIPERFMAFQLHGETFEIPAGGRLLFCGSKVINQGFRIRNAIALQFHLETDAAMIDDWTADLSGEEKTEIASGTSRYLDESNCIFRRIASEFLS